LQQNAPLLLISILFAFLKKYKVQAFKLIFIISIKV